MSKPHIQVEALLCQSRWESGLSPPTELTLLSSNCQIRLRMRIPSREAGHGPGQQYFLRGVQVILHTEPRRRTYSVGKKKKNWPRDTEACVILVLSTLVIYFRNSQHGCIAELASSLTKRPILGIHPRHNQNLQGVKLTQVSAYR